VSLCDLCGKKVVDIEFDVDVAVLLSPLPLVRLILCGKTGVELVLTINYER